MAKAGRKRKVGVARVRGRISQRKGDVLQRISETEDEATKTARMARERIFGIKPEDTTMPMAGYVVGRLRYQGIITTPQLMAALRFEEIHAGYKRALASLVGTPGPLRAAQIGSVRGRGRVLEDDVIDRAISRYDAATAAVLTENSILAHRGCNLLAALQHIVIADRDFPHMHGDLRLALNALQHHFGVSEDEDTETLAKTPEPA